MFEEASSAFQPLLDIKAEMHDIEHRLGDAAVPEAEHDAMLARYSELQDRFRLGDGYSMDLRIATVLRGLGFSPDDARPAVRDVLRRLADAHRAGQAAARPPESAAARRADQPPRSRRAQLARGVPRRAIPYAVILVSHDRYFLDAVVTRITDLNLRKLTDYVGNYSKYVEQRDAMLERLRQAKREQDEEVARVKMFIDRFRYQATKAAQVQSRIKLLEKVVPIEVPPERKRIHFTFPTCAKSGRTVFELKHVRKAYGDRHGLQRSHRCTSSAATASRWSGPNGAGKSTLMRMLSGEEAARRGHAHGRPPGRDGVLRPGRSDHASTRR